MMNRMVLGALVVLAASPAFAQTQEQRDGCQPDAAKYCQEVGTEISAIAQCLGRNFRKLSPECRQVLKAATVQKVCAQQIATNCAGAGESSGAVVACLERSNRVPANCRNALKAYRR